MKPEEETRIELIDKQLFNSGWNVDDQTKVAKEYFIASNLTDRVSESSANYQTQQYSDYVLLGKDGKPLAVVEAKKSSSDAEIGREQAKQYYYRIREQTKGELPFCFYTNGHDLYFWDLENYPPRKVMGFPTRDDLERFQYIRRNRKALTNELINTNIAGRDYQIRAIRSVLDGITKKQRDFLLVMATGTGKTRTCIALVDALMRSGHAEKVLFLVDRIALREQALDAFKEYLPNEPRWPNVAEKIIAKDRRVYVSTYPSMLNIIREESQSLSPHFFDFIIVDESHRSIYNTYKEVLDYFKTTTLGLTATPTDIIDHNTFQLFHCADGIPSFAYSYEEAINNTPPYLCDFQVMKIQTKFQKEGISKRTISLEDQKKLIFEGKEIEEINFEGTQLEKQVTNKDTNSLIVREFMEESIKDQNGLPGKTIFFCLSKSHARRIETLFDELYPHHKGELAKVIVSDDPRVYGKGGLLEQFTNNDFPRIAISVDMLDTGIDVREIVNLVFAKPVYSYTKFWQMIGRGTRLLEPSKIKPWCMEKSEFLILDCWDNFEYFKLTPKGKETKPQIALPVKVAGLRLDKIEKALEVNEEEIARLEFEKIRLSIQQLPIQSIVIKEASAVLASLNDIFWQSVDSAKIELLRSEIKPLFRTISDVDFKAMRFERDVLTYSIAVLSGEKSQADVIKNSLIEQVSDLPLTIHFVNAEKVLIDNVKTPQFWQHSSQLSLNDALDTLMNKLGPLMKFRDADITKTSTTAFNFKDEVIHKEKVEFGPENESVSISRYREMVESLIIELTESNSILKQLKNGKDISEEETQSLADMLYAEHPHITEDLLRLVYKNRKARFIEFIRHILGLESLASFPEKVSEAFEQFIQQHTYLNSRQMEFLGLLKGFILERETVAKKDLIYAPFTVIHPQGIRGVFNTAEINEILQLTEQLVA
ncbi:DEAD/DEAH box helicase family protein [Marinomonas sp. 2405UD66-6]|uniref:type I restriction endonuclease subunit R n=1 Tax=Marinomonas sp. 2405UD66-6 TaxID=3391834 RepID=UPI0039C99C13